MTTRKPPNMSFPDWVDSQIRGAEAAGAFQDLPGKGKPIPGIDRPQHEMAWIVEKLRRENVDIAAVLPPALALAKEVESLPDRLGRERSETRVRSIVDELNTRIRQAQRAPQDGPPFRVRTVPIDTALARWRADVAARTPAISTAAPAVVPPKRAGLFARRRRS